MGCGKWASRSGSGCCVHHHGTTTTIIINPPKALLVVSKLADMAKRLKDRQWLAFGLHGGVLIVGRARQRRGSGQAVVVCSLHFVRHG